MDRKDTHDEAAQRVADFDTAAPPAEQGRVDRGREDDFAEQLAAVDVASGGIDAELLAALAGELPGEHRIRTRFGTWRAAIVQEAAAAEQLDVQLLHGVRTEGSVDRAGERSGLEAEAAALREGLAGAGPAKEAAEALLDGRQRAEDGASWAGDRPETLPELPVHGPDAPRTARRARVRLALRGAVLRHVLEEWGLLVAAAVVEGLLLVGPIQQAAHDDDVWHAAALSVSAVVSATVFPHLIGGELAAIRRGARLSLRRSWVLLLGLLWLLGAVLIGTLREQHIETTARLQAAAAEGVDPASVRLTGFAPGFELLLWIALLTFVGAAVLLIKVLRGNPVSAQLVRLHTGIALRRWRLAIVEVALARLDALEREREALAEAHRSVMALTQERFGRFAGELLPALEAEALGVYSATLAQRLGSPDATGLIAQRQEDRAAGRAPLAPVEPLDPEDDELRRTA